LDLLLQSILPFLLILLGLVVIHEAGHYFTAKLFGVKVLEAGVGLPPKVWGFTWRGTEYTINALPLGAFVRMLGEEDPSDPQSLAAQHKWKRVIIIGSGAFMNLVTAIALFAVSLMVPQTVSAGGAVIAAVVPGSPAEQAGLRAGDQIAEINGRAVESTSDASYFIRLGQGTDIDFTIKRTDPRTGTETLEREVYSRWDPGKWVDECGVEQSQGPTGISIGTRHGQSVPLTRAERADLEPEARDAFRDYRRQVKQDAPASCIDGRAFGFAPIREAQCAELTPDEQRAARELKQDLFAESEAPCYEFDPPAGFVAFTKTRQEPPWEAIPNGIRLSFESLILTRNTIWSLVRGFDSGSTSSPLAGPVGIAQATGEVVDEAGWLTLITLAGSLSMSLAILNILPLPMLDGGRLVFIAIEALRGGRRIDPEKEALVHLTGFVAMILLAVIITYFDIIRWVNGDSLLR
jgi:regulator of sigma E protease